ncbi:type VII secretion system-associated protein [Streptomyces levis]
MRPQERHVVSQGDLPEPADTPDIPDAVRAAARQAPGHWIGVVDPEWAEERTPPDWAVVGEWQSDESGEVTGFRENPVYRPSARTLGWPEPTDPVDAAAQRAATGYGTVDEALAALAEAEVSVVRGPDGRPLVAAGRDGAPVVLLFTSPVHAFMSPALHHDTVQVRELARSLSGPGTLLMVNAGAAAPLLVPADDLPGTAPAEPAASEAASPVAPRDNALSDEPWPPTTGSTP